MAVLTILTVLAVSEITNRVTLLRKINDGIDQLLRSASPVDVIVDQQEVWERARLLLKASGGYSTVYDTTSIRNNEAYENEIENQLKKGARIARFVCAPPEKALDELIELPKDPVSLRDGRIEIRHIPHALPFDCLIVQSLGSVGAIIGFKTSEEQTTEYSSALHVEGDRVARELLSIHQNVYAAMAKQHMASVKLGQCRICDTINRSKQP